MTTSSYSIADTPTVPSQTRNAIDWMRISMAERIFTVIILFYLTGAVLPLITGVPDAAAVPTTPPMDLAVKASLYTIAFLFMIPKWQSLIRAAWDIRWVILPIPIAFASAAWSQDPSLTFRGALVLAATTAFGIYFGACYSISQQLQLLSWTFSLVFIFSFLFAFFLPMYGIEQGVNAGNWRGAFPYKNVLAEAMVLAFFVFLFARPVIRRSLRWLGIAAALTLLFLSGSATGVVVCSAIMLTLPLYKLARARFTLVVSVSLLLVLLFGTVLLAWRTGAAEALHLVNRSSDLTGRTELWNAVLLSISKRPWLGYGFSAFWLGMHGESESVLKAAGWLAGYAHDGFLDLLLQIGVLGLITFVAGYILLWRRAIASLFKATDPALIWLCTFLVFICFYNFTEGSSILAQNTVYWTIYISNAICIMRFRSTRHSAALPDATLDLCTDPEWGK